MTLTIDKGVTMPSRKKTGEIGGLVTQMQIGDSVLTTYKASGGASVFTLAARRQKLRYTFNSFAEGEGCRVFRVA